MSEALPSHLVAYAGECAAELGDALRAALGSRRRTLVTGIVCRCGARALFVGAAFNWEVVDAACGECGHELPIYDPVHHGRLGRARRNDYPRPPFDATPLGCMCRGMVFEPAVALAYDGESEDADDFVALAVGGRCVACGVDNVWLDVECD